MAQLDEAVTLAPTTASGLTRARYRVALARRIQAANQRRRSLPAWFVHDMGGPHAGALARALRQQPGRPLLSRSRCLSPSGLERETRSLEEVFASSGSVDPTLWAGYHLKWLVDTGRAASRVHIVSVVQEPIERSVAKFFDDLWFTHPHLAAAEVTDQVVDQTVDAFWNDFDHEAVLEWWRDELMGPLGLDPGTPAVDALGRDLGGWTFRGAADVLLVRADDLARRGAEALQDFLGQTEIRLDLGASPSMRATDVLRRRFLDVCVVPDGHLDHMYDSEFATTFWTPTELRRFRERWSTRNRC